MNKSKGSAAKAKQVQSLSSTLKKYKTIAVIELSGFPSKNFEEMRKVFRGKADFVYKNKVVVIRTLESIDKNLMEKASGVKIPVLMLSQLSPFEIARISIENTPFMAGLTRNVTYSNLLDNGSVSTAYDIYNASALYNVSSSAIRNYTNPSEFLLIYNSSSLVFNNKIGIIFVYSNSTFSAVQDLLLKSALDSFGNFSGLSLTNSSSVAVTPTETVGRIEYYNLLKMPYSSGFFSLQTYNLSNVVSSQEAEKVLFEYDQNAGQAAFSQLGNFMPFLDIGGRYIEVSSMLNPVLFSGLSVSQLQQKINSDPTMRDMFDQSVAFLDAVLCSYTNNSEPICRSSSVTSAATAIRNQI